MIVPCPVILKDNSSQITKFMGPTWGPTGSCQPQLHPMLAPWTLLSGQIIQYLTTTRRHELQNMHIYLGIVLSPQWWKLGWWVMRCFMQTDGSLYITLPSIMVICKTDEYVNPLVNQWIFGYALEYAGFNLVNWLNMEPNIVIFIRNSRFSNQCHSSQ